MAQSRGEAASALQRIAQAESEAGLAKAALEVAEHRCEGLIDRVLSLGDEVVAARDYLTNPTYYRLRGARVFNLCRSYRYQSMGYYVSLLAEARQHHVLPSIRTIQDFRSQTMVRSITDRRR